MTKPIPDSGIGELIERLRDQCIDYDGTQMHDHAEPRGMVNCGDLREAADTLATLTAELSEAQAREARMRGLLEEAWHFVKAIEEYEGQRHTKRWEQSLDLRKRIDAALSDPCATDEEAGK